MAVSDLFTERNQFEMMYTTLTELRKVHPSEDEILIQYLIPATCKAAAVLGMVRNSHGNLFQVDEFRCTSPYLPLRNLVVAADLSCFKIQRHLT